MLELWIKTISLFIVLFITGGILIYFIKSGLNSEDSIKIDPDPTQKKE